MMREKSIKGAAAQSNASTEQKKIIKGVLKKFTKNSSLISERSQKGISPNAESNENFYINNKNQE